jgi:hypothetical protein
MRLAIKWGVLLALAVILWTVGVHLLGIYTVRIQYAHAVDTAAFVLPVTVLTLALLQERQRLGGELALGRGVFIGATVGAVSAPPTVVALWIYHHFVNPEWLSLLASYEQTRLAGAGVPPDEIATTLARLLAGGTDRQQAIGGLVGTVVMGLILSFVITLVLGVRRPR